MIASRLFVAMVLCILCAAQASPLWDYVNEPDDTFQWVDTGYRLRPPNSTAKKDQWTGYLLNVTSQTWLTPEVVSRSVWHHQLMVFVPDNVIPGNIGLIYNTGGSNPISDRSPGLTDPEILLISGAAAETQTITSIIWQIPNQPIVFAADPTHAHRSEDAAVGFSWYEFMFGKDVPPEMVLFMPMVKAVSKGMTAVTEFVKELNGMDVDQFMVCGASKRGWTTWLTGAVDSRVIGIAPIVMDMLNFKPNVLHMIKAYGGWTFAFQDYYDLNLTEWFDIPEVFDPLVNIIDPLVYKENLTMPKLVIDATDDEFFMPDDDHFWWGDLEGETYRLMVANADHTFITGLEPLYMGLSAFYESLVLHTERPVINWSMANGTGAITATTNVEPIQAVAWVATTRGEVDEGRRDFRIFKGNTPHDPCHTIPLKFFGFEACFNPIVWIGDDIRGTQVGNVWQFNATQNMPAANQWRGFFIDFYFPGPAEGFTFRMTTQVSIIPQVFPFPPCSGKACKSFLV